MAVHASDVSAGVTGSHAAHPDRQLGQNTSSASVAAAIAAGGTENQPAVGPKPISVPAATMPTPMPIPGPLALTRSVYAAMHVARSPE